MTKPADRIEELHKAAIAWVNSSHLLGAEFSGDGGAEAFMAGAEYAQAQLSQLKAENETLFDQVNYARILNGELKRDLSRERETVARLTRALNEYADHADNSGWHNLADEIRSRALSSEPSRKEVKS